MTVELVTGYVLHQRPYRENSTLVDLLTKEQGRLKVICKTLRKQRHQKLPTLQPFVSYWFQLKKQQTLLSCYHWETNMPPFKLNGEALYCAFYLNELLYRLLPSHDTSTDIFQLYTQTLNSLTIAKNTLDIVLRLFEKQLLIALGYGLPLLYEAESDAFIEPTQVYCFVTDLGFIKATKKELSQQANRCFFGKDLLAIAEDNYLQDNTRQSAKRLMRLALRDLLGGKPLNSRALFPVKRK
ncbi:DNA repair protein RecO [Zooshikella harenae]|uniref:DNA repair protein RecO n=1 Tax=Zooshikella harenae TaxID=2827238 RepID=A0ABS5Z6Z7_9GAMM|nr:DNA repair protein RecO [Zooshikella harenae]MBU2709708.1 DNA repair protein RecO [Zooshikella harenae]